MRSSQKRLSVMDRSEVKGKGLNGKCITALVAAIRQCGVPFNVWKKSDGDGGGSGRYDWTSLMGKDKRKLLAHVPDKLRGIITDDTVDTVIELWKASFLWVWELT